MVGRVRDGLGLHGGVDGHPFQLQLTHRAGLVAKDRWHEVFRKAIFEHVHDEEVWVAFTEDIVRGMGGDAAGARECAADMVRRWEIHEYSHLYDDALPVMQSLREHRLSIGLISNGQRDLEEFAEHHMLDVDCAVGSKAHGRAKPHASIFERALSILDVAAAEAVMVGDSYADDIEGARALGMRAILLDRDGRHPGEDDRITDLFQLPVALGLPAS